MKILSCHIENFGCLSHMEYSFKDGFNILCSPNGSGKSTLAVFIKVMFYGLPKSRKSDLTENERTRYTPWQGGKYGGSLIFEADAHTYRIERFFAEAEKNDTFALFDEQTGKESTAFSANVGNELFGVDAEGFERSVYVSQRMPHAEVDKNQSIMGKLGDLLDASDDLGQYPAAFAALDKLCKQYRTTGKRGKVFDIYANVQAKEKELNEAKTAKNDLPAHDRALQEIDAQMKQLDEAQEALRLEKEALATRRATERKAVEYKRLCDIADQKRAALLEQKAFFGDDIPTQADIQSASERLKQAEHLQIRLESVAFSAEKQAEIDILTQKYPVPLSEQEQKQLLTLAAAIKDKQQQAAALLPQDQEKRQELGRHFDAPSHIPTEQEENALTQAAAEYRDAEEALLAGGTKQPNKFQIPCIALGVASLLCAVAAGILFATSLIPAASVLLALTVGSAVLATLLFFKGKKGDTKQDAFKRIKAALVEMLAPFRYTEEPKTAVALLLRDAAEYRRLTEKERERLAAKDALLADIASLQIQIDDILLAHGLGEDCKTDLALIGTECQRLSLLQKEKAEAEAEQKKIERQKTEQENAVRSLLSRYPALCDMSVVDGLQALSEAFDRCVTLIDELQEAQNNCKEFCEREAYDPALPLPPYEKDEKDIDQADKDLQVRMNALVTARAEQRVKKERCEAIAEKLDELQQELDRLVAELKAAEHTFALLEQTRSLLSEAKEALSTRYMAGMKASFDRFYQALSVNETDFKLDTELKLSVTGGGATLPVEVLSCGQRDLAMFCMRLSLVDAIFGKEKPLLLLDDPFVNLDDENGKKAVSFLNQLSEEYQILYFVCRRERAEMMQKA